MLAGVYGVGSTVLSATQVRISSRIPLTMGGGAMVNLLSVLIESFREIVVIPELYSTTDKKANYTVSGLLSLKHGGGGVKGLSDFLG